MEVKKQKKINIKIKKLENINNINIHYNVKIDYNNIKLYIIKNGIYSKSTSKRIYRILFQ